MLYIDCKFTDRENITVALEKHNIYTTEKLGSRTSEVRQRPNVQLVVAERWKELLEETEIVPIDVHTSMWLWNRGNFTVDI